MDDDVLAPEESYAKYLLKILEKTLTEEGALNNIDLDKMYENYEQTNPNCKDTKQVFKDAFKIAAAITRLNQANET